MKITSKSLEGALMPSLSSYGVIGTIMLLGGEPGPEEEIPAHTQPSYEHLADAFVAGAMEARKNPSATEHDFIRASDGYCKLIQQDLDPVLFKQLGDPPLSWITMIEEDLLAIEAKYPMRRHE